jgi:hypothetical protein
MESTARTASSSESWMVMIASETFHTVSLELDFSHCAAYQSASMKCFIRAMGLLAAPSPQPIAKSLCLSLRLPPAHEEEWLTSAREKGIRAEQVS